MIYRRYGDYHPEAECARDLPGHSLVSLDRDIERPGRANVITLHREACRAGRRSTAPRSRPTTYYGQQFIPAQPTLSLSPRAELSALSWARDIHAVSDARNAPFPFTEMYIGDTASANFRQAVAERLQRSTAWA